MIRCAERCALQLYHTSLSKKRENKSQFSVHQYYVKETPLNRHRFFVHRIYNRNVYQKNVKFDKFCSLAYSCNVDTMSTSNKSGYWAVTFLTIYFTTSIKSELTRKIFFVSHAILLYNFRSDIAALLQNSKNFACCLIQKICWTQGCGDLTLHISALLDIW